MNDASNQEIQMSKFKRMGFAALAAMAFSAAFAVPVSPREKCMYNCGAEGFTYATCSRICDL